MANQLASNPLMLDGSSLNTVLIKTMMDIEHFEWAGYSGTSDSVVLADKIGNVVWRATAASDKEEVRSGKVNSINGLQELTHSSGYVLVYLK